jgi:uncharacterized protein (TIGR03067 family)
MRAGAVLLLGILSTVAIGSARGTVSTQAAPCAADDKKEDKVAKELKKLTGTWAVESATLYGRPLKLDIGTRYEFKDASLKNFVIDGAGPTGFRIVELDVTKDPKRMTLTEAEMKGGRLVQTTNGEVVRAVYALKDGDLTIVQSRGKKGEFPRSVKPEAGELVMVLILKRDKDNK